MSINFSDEVNDEIITTAVSLPEDRAEARRWLEPEREQIVAAQQGFRERRTRGLFRPRVQ